MRESQQQKCVMIVAGEASGDLHGSNLVKEMQRKDNNLFFCGIGGDALADSKVRILVNASKLSVVGITEVFSKLPSLLDGMAVAKKLIKSLKPDLLILIDFPDFNLHIASIAKKAGVPVLYYISPQIWAWRSGRIKKIKALVDHMAVILPFEADFYKENDVPVTFVGHPLLDNQHPPKTPNNDLNDSGDTIIGLLPGSRDREITRHLPVLMKAAHIIQKQSRNIKFLVSIAPSVDRELFERIVSGSSKGLNFEYETEGVDNVFHRSSFVVAASGTVTLEAAISGTPMLIVYKVSPVSYWLGKYLVSIKNVGLVNLIADEEIVPELLQNDATPENIADYVLSMINDNQKLQELRQRLLKIRELLGGSGASGKTAEIAINMLRHNA
ncbi:MAG: lipid-A-disaccharide synthase [Desulfobacterales bacterium]|jgi:lipid-A-disaccharide synthase|nr:lipid-A-disaccharide synthase [Desulfobacteraceae bacterium]MBT4364408.1 lipid-A-disaccharide synthase [Desulfobacteraceae bacterium]MBT7085697.1 lipid-A-disaccharide synthase [Desulfobacterales bacterium]MBT7696232.1 lipid-A-disaccharide synthase [Desulfobacterales bacterium]